MPPQRHRSSAPARCAHGMDLEFWACPGDQRGEHVLNTGFHPADTPVRDLIQLAELLGGTVGGFTCQLLELAAMATTASLYKLSVAFPREIFAYQVWMMTTPTPTGEQLVAMLADIDGNTRSNDDRPTPG
jgi:hypothetical protein